MNSMEIFQNGDPAREWTIYDDIAENCGQDVAISLFEELAGVELKVPRSVDTVSGQMLAESIGREEAESLCKTFPGDKFYLPQQAYFQRMGRKKRITQMLFAGNTPLDIAKIEGVSERYVRMVRSEYKKAHPSAFSAASASRKLPASMQ